MIDFTFAHHWHAEILSSRPLILPARQFVYPAQVEEVERGALEVMVRPHGDTPFLATCALGFAGQGAAHGVWACPDPACLCAVAGGYAYLIDTRNPLAFHHLEYRPVTAVLPVLEQQLLIFSSFHRLLAWGLEGRRWETGRLSWDGVRLGAVQGAALTGFGWDMETDAEVEFVVDLQTGKHRGGGYRR